MILKPRPGYTLRFERAQTWAVPGWLFLKHLRFACVQVFQRCLAISTNYHRCYRSALVLLDFHVFFRLASAKKNWEVIIELSRKGLVIKIRSMQNKS